MTSIGDQSCFLQMFKLAMAAFLPCQVPAVLFDQFYQINYFHACCKGKCFISENYLLFWNKTF